MALTVPVDVPPRDREVLESWLRAPSVRVLTRVDLADDGVIHVADDGGVEGPRPLVADGALVGLVPGCSVW